MLSILLALVTTSQAQTLDMSGPCPGRITVEVTGLTPGGDAAFITGVAGEGSDTLGMGPCSGTETGLAGLRFLTRIPDSDRDGMLRLRPTVSGPTCSAPFQVLDLATCELSNVASPGDSRDCGPVGSSCALTGEPDPAAVFDDGVATYFFSNNLVGTNWHRETDTLFAGHYSSTGYYSFPAFSGDYPALPDNDVGVQYGRTVLVPATGVVVRNNGDQFASPGTDHSVGVIDPATGTLSGFEPPVFSDGFAGNCNLLSASADEFLCFDGANVRHYGTEPGSGDLTLNATVALAAPLPRALCDSFCFGGRFAWDGMYYYLPDAGNDSSNITYQVYDADGGHVGTYDVTGGNAINSLFFDWSACRYTSHDGYGNRSLGATYTWAGGSFSDDSQTYGPESADHTPVSACD